MSGQSLTIITVCYNAELSLENTILSVINQSYESIQYIVIDGGSTDRSSEIIEKYHSDIDILVTEPDKGIYDAMNKGVHLAEGEWIYFLNAGDTIHDATTFEHLFSEPTDADLIYGKHKAVYSYFERVHEPAALENIKYGMIFSHQGMIVKTQLLKANPFNISYRYSADYNFIYHLYQQGAKFVKTDLIFSCLEAGGVSEVNIKKTHSERWKIARSYEKGLSRLGLDMHYLRELLRLNMVNFIKAVLPKKTVQRLTMKKYE